MNEKITPELRQAVREYYNWHGEKYAKCMRIVRDKNDLECIIVRFAGENETALSSLVHFMRWEDGHYDVTEMFSCNRNDEDDMVKRYQESGFDKEETMYEYM